MEILRSTAQALLSVTALVLCLASLPALYQAIFYSMESRWAYGVDAAQRGVYTRRPASPPSQIKAAGLAVVADAALVALFYVLIFKLVP